MLSSSFQEITSLKSPSPFLTSHPLNMGFAQGSHLIPLLTLHVLAGAFLLLWHQFRLITWPSSSLTIWLYQRNFPVFLAT